MKTILSKLTDEQAQTEVKLFSVIGAAMSVVGLFVFWPLVMGGIAASARGLLLTWHKANKGTATKYRIIATVGVLASIVTIISVRAAG